MAGRTRPTPAAMAFRVGIGHDTHRLEADRPLILGGVPVPHSSGLVGHSDADVLVHAIVDAILGALGEGDIGELFPDDDPANKDRDSMTFLRHVLERRMPVGGRVVNLDAIIFAERPKLSAYKQSIRASLASALDVPQACVNIKAKTGELVGPVGRMEAMCAQAVVLLELPDSKRDPVR